MNHKRGRPKNRRSGCLMCKPWKMNGAKGPRPNKEAAKRKQMLKDAKEL